MPAQKGTKIQKNKANFSMEIFSIQETTGGDRP